MQTAPIQPGATRPEDRSRRALLLALARVIAITGFALAGWLALAALTDSASAAEHYEAPPKNAPELHNSPPASDTATKPNKARPALATPTAPVLPDTPLDGTRLGSAPLSGARLTGARLADASLNGPLADAPPEGAALTDVPLDGARVEGARVDGGVTALDGVSGRVREIGADPVRFLRDRGDEVLDGEVGAVRQVRDLAGVAGVPRVRVPDVRQGPSVVDGFVDGIADIPPGLHTVPSGEGHDRPAADDEARQAQDVAGDATGARSGRPSLVRSASADDEAPGHCVGCHGDQPVPPPAQDNPRGSGHSFAPVADLRGGRYPAVPSLVGANTFHRSALTDVSAPGGPSVVPD